MGTELEPGDPSQIGKYRLVEVLGSGGMGRVYLGRSAGGRPVAVKVIRADVAADPEFRSRFRREVAAARLVNGLYTAVVIDADTDAPMPWLATAYIDGPSLAAAVHDRGPLPPASLRDFAAGLAEGLAAIHAVGLVHRDLKPSNVLLAADGPRVIDFGIARAIEATSLTETNAVVGSPGYLSPEQAMSNRGVGPATDVFSLGAVLCYAATGHGPWGTGSTVAMIYRVVHGEPDIDDVPDLIKPMVVRCLAKEPGQRPTAAEILAELGDPALVDRQSSAAASRTPAAPPPPEPGRPATAPTATVSAAGLRGRSAVNADTPPHGKAPASTARAGPAAPDTAPGSHEPQPPTSPRAPARGPARGRRRRYLAWAATAVAVIVAAVAVPKLVTRAQQGTGTGTGTGSASAPAGSSLPALLGVYSGSGYGFNRPNGIAADSSHVWVLNGGNDSVTELDARTGAWVRTLTAASYGFQSTFNDTTGIVDDGTDVWVGNQNSITEINAQSGALVRTLRVPASVGIHGWFTALVRVGSALWGASPDTCRPYCVSATLTGFYASAFKFNAGDGSYVRVFSAPTIQAPIALTTDGTHLWSVGSDVETAAHQPSQLQPSDAGTVAELSDSDGHVLWSTPATVHYDPQGDSVDSIAYANGHLWVANGTTVTELNAGNGKQVGSLAGAADGLDAPAAVTAAGDKVFVANGAGANPVAVIDARTGALAYTLSAAKYHLGSLAGIAVAGNRAWIVNSSGSVVELAL